MRIDVDTDRMLIISDLHIGNPFSEAKRKLNGLFEYVRRERCDLCINGDGFEILQASFKVLARDSAGVLTQLQRLMDGGTAVYYTIGNHDIALEHLLETSLVTAISPFLNVRSGGRRIRVEHGHLYDPFFVKHPDLYELITRACGPLLNIYPDMYRAWSRYQQLKDRWSKRRAASGLEASVYYEAAQRIAARGFDAVVFGHTHRPERVDLGDGATYFNSGNWMRGRSYIEIADGEVSLRRWGG